MSVHRVEVRANPNRPDEFVVDNGEESRSVDYWMASTIERAIAYGRWLEQQTLSVPISG